MRKFLFCFSLFLLLSTRLFGGTITGKVVVSSTNTPLANVYVYAAVYTSSIIDTMTSYYSKTNVDGVYSIPIRTAGKFNVTVKPAGYVSQVKGPVSVGTDSVVTVNFALEPISLIKGLVKNATTNLPVMGATLTLTAPNAGTLMYTTLSDSAGYFNFYSITNGSYQLSVSRNGYKDYVYNSIINITPLSKTITLEILLTPVETTPLSGSIKGGVFEKSLLTVMIPVPKTKIEFRSTNPVVSRAYTAYSDSNGRYEVTKLVPDTYLLMVTNEAYYSDVISPVVINADSTVFLNIFIEKIKTVNNFISGTITDKNTSAPLPSALVHLSFSGEERVALALPEPTTRSDSSGNYIFKNIIPGVYKLWAEKSRFVSGVYSDSLPVTTSTQLSSRNFTLQSAEIPEGLGSVNGMVFAILPTTVTSLEGAKITLWPQTSTMNSLYYSAVSDKNGAYSIPNIRTGSYVATCTKDGYVSVKIYPCKIDTGYNSLSFQLKKSVALNGTIKGVVLFDSLKTPVAGAIIDFISMASTCPSASVVTDATGAFSKELPAGKYIVACSFISGNSIVFRSYYDNVPTQSQATVLSLNAGETKEAVNFIVPPFTSTPLQFSISGVVTDILGIPIESAKICVAGISNSDAASYVGKTDKNGIFRFTVNTMKAVTSYSFVVSANHEGYAVQFFNNKPAQYLADKLIAKNGSAITDIKFSLTPLVSGTENHSIGGKFLSPDKQPIADAYVVTFQLKTKFLNISITDSTGSYLSNDLKPGNYYILFFKKGYAPQFYDNQLRWENAKPITIVDSDVTNIDAVLKNISTVKLANAETLNGIIVGIVRDGNNTPLAGALVSVIGSSGEVVDFALTDDQGNYSVESLSEGSYNLVVSQIDYSTSESSFVYDPVNGNTQKLDFTLTPETATKVDETGLLPLNYSLSAYPNPFNPSTTITYALPVAGKVSLRIFNALGQEVCTLLNSEYKEAGSYKVLFSALKFSSGIYIYRLESGHTNISKKIVLVK